MTDLLLASASPRRRDLLQQLGLGAFQISPSDCDETPLAGELPGPYAQRMARSKALAATLEPNRLILAADTVVAVGRRILPKAETLAQARACLDLLSGRSHQVFGAICLRSAVSKDHDAQAIDGAGAERLVCRLVTTRVTVARLDQAQREAYLASEEWRGKAGGYAIQGRFAAHIARINGSYSNVVGLSLYDTARLLRGHGFHW